MSTGEEEEAEGKKAEKEEGRGTKEEREGGKGERSNRGSILMASRTLLA